MAATLSLVAMDFLRGLASLQAPPPHTPTDPTNPTNPTNPTFLGGASQDLCIGRGIGLELVETELFRLAIASRLSVVDLRQLRQVSRRMHILVDDLLPVSDAFMSWNAVRHTRNEPAMLWVTVLLPMSAFSYCSALAKIALPPELTQIGGRAFRGSPSLCRAGTRRGIEVVVVVGGRGEVGQGGLAWSQWREEVWRGWCWVRVVTCRCDLVGQVAPPSPLCRSLPSSVRDVSDLASSL